MNRHFTAVALMELLIGPPNEEEAARATKHIDHCPRCRATAARRVAQLKAGGSTLPGGMDGRDGIISRVEGWAGGTIAALVARAWWAEIRDLSYTEQIRKIRAVAAMQCLAVFDAILSEAIAVGRNDPFAGESLARVAFFVADHLPEPRYRRTLKNDLRGEAMIVVGNCRRIAANWTGAAEDLAEARR